MVNLQILSGVLIVSFHGRWRPSANHPDKGKQGWVSAEMSQTLLTNKKQAHITKPTKFRIYRKKISMEIGGAP